MNSGISEFHKILKDDTRRRIILLLHQKGSLGYVDLMKSLGITNTGKMNYHLKVLADLLSKKENGQYSLSEKGTLASRLLLEFPDRGTGQLGSGRMGPQVFWWGIIVCVFTSIGLFILVRYMYAEFLIGYLTDMVSFVPLIFMAATFLTIGSYMIFSDLRKNPKPNGNQNRLTKRKAIFLVSLILLGTSLVLLARSTVASESRLTQIGREDNMMGSESYTISLEQDSVCQIDLTVNTTEIGQTYNVSVRQVEDSRSVSVNGGSVVGPTVSITFPAQSIGHYEVDWSNLDVVELAAYKVDTVIPLISRSVLSAAGVFAFFAGIFSVLGFERGMFSNRKTGIFWWGLLVFGLALSWLFGRLWWGLVTSSYYNPLFFGLSINVAEILASLAFLFAGFYMMKRGARKVDQTYEAKMFRLEFYLSQRNYRALVYLLTSLIINTVLVSAGSMNLYYVNFVGFVLLILLYGRPSMYGGWIDPASVLPYALLVFGLFVEIFTMCEFLISVQKLAPRIRNRKSSNPAS